MKIVHAPVRKEAELDLKLLDKVKGKIGLVCTVQYCHLIKEVKKYLGKRGVVGGQVLGCDVNVADMSCDAIILLSDGDFHALEIARKTKKHVYVFNEAGLRKLDEKQVELLEKKRWARISKAQRAKTFGFIVSIKPGQNRLKEVERTVKDRKDCYVFVCDTVNYQELLNFPFIDCWVNTACPRITDDDAGVLLISFEDFIELETRKT